MKKLAIYDGTNAAQQIWFSQTGAKLIYPKDAGDDFLTFLAYWNDDKVFYNHKYSSIKELLLIEDEELKKMILQIKRNGRNNVKSNKRILETS